MHMKKRIVTSILFVAGCLSVFPTIAQDSIVTRPVIIVTDKEQSGDSEIIRKMYESNGEHFQDPRAPRFLFIDRQGKVALGIGGYVKGTMSVDMDGISNNLDFVTADIPVPNQADMRSQFQMDASTSRLFLKLVGENTQVGDFTVYLESDFRGKNGHQYDMRLRQAYIQFWHLKIGRARTTFADAASSPPTIDFEGPSGSVSTKNTMIQYSQALGKHWSMAMAFEAPSASYTTDKQLTETIKQRLPDIPSYIQYAWDEGKSHIRLSNLFRFLSYRNLAESQNKFTFGWASQLSGMLTASPHWIFYYQAAYGKGYADYLNDLSGSGYDLIPEGDSGKLEAPYALGLVGGIQYNFSKNLFVSASYSQCRLYASSSLPETSYRYAQYIVANAFYSPFRNCMVGLEYLYGNRHDVNRTSGNAHRINAMIQYHF